MKHELPTLEVSAWWARMLIGRRPARTLIRLGVLVVFSLVLFRVLVVPIRVTGHSMEPTYRSGRINFLNQLAYRSHGPQRGDVVGIQREGSLLVVLKRIAGLPGERVAVLRGQVFIDGSPLDEPYAHGFGIRPTPAVIELGADEYFAIGDNREVTAYDVVNRREIKGRIMF